MWKPRFTNDQPAKNECMSAPEVELETQEINYWQATARPLTSLIFVLPMLAVYEAGVLMLGPDAIRNGVDVWLRQFLGLMGLGQYFLLPVLTIAILLSWHHLKSYPWQFRPTNLPLMAAESMVLGLMLLCLAHFQASVMQMHVVAANAGPEVDTTTKQVVAYFGAGIYEELLFRLMLIPVLIVFIQGFAFPKLVATFAAMLISSLVFAAAHYNFFVTGGDPIDGYTFLFRLSAGLIFASIFALRGFGIAAGSHAMYDVLVAFS
ncbi:CPBP family intramembrane glutamic endopeptidase [Bremerella sp. P1]|uniref:CPBP family intramembrane glutamic endopeptidase n=1 Tax=Bremerella sp. P1 TaxID=3026424 RepID=UPI0023674A17|nr:CPBP family intramembrane glutamic endopeptidase [Bremerella sp. P1]WDI44271.1 CPBP family intramembrane metalloprotease [Bremerella sp. P1]